MRRPDAKVEKFYLNPKPVDFRKSIHGLAAWAAIDEASFGKLLDSVTAADVLNE
ncbi:IS66 Orf2 family protein [Pseudomonas syringae pv. cilantro]|uniref:IS66 Orf2 family protein n=2 Tax=Pseudomonas syringae group TaxID=136849 RepID=A0A0N0XB92_PSESX|nr:MULTISPECIES: transposase [Pseudomonas syringae group]KPC28506.1 IS66 Orf2 family protein [Pseudomonas syringae pv. cilantro]KPW75831.1 IS66 Orf2 family protein [Pseudomonas syringae pv. coriandricola]RMN08898.1 hypothetical protein ALQ65_02941 [Pseudomonas syringae pv. coriandricola]